MGGVFTDVRYQFWQNEEWTFAIAPGIGGVGLPVGGIVDFRIPLRAQRSLSPNVDFVTGIVPVSQNTFVLVVSKGDICPISTEDLSCFNRTHFLCWKSRSLSCPSNSDC